MHPSDAPIDDEAAHDVDLTLRHVTHRFPDELARALIPEARTLDGCTWLDTQLTARERRMDKSLHVVADGVARVEHVEWQLRWTRDLLLRAFEYHALTTLALHDAAKEGDAVPRVRSTVVLLRGRRRAPWPAYRTFRTTPPGERFSGLRVRIEAVYQRTLAELAARRSPLWMAFAPLAVDASADTLPAVVRALRSRTPPTRFAELAVAMTVLADADGRARGLARTIKALLPKELVMRSLIFREALEQGRAEGMTRGRAQGLDEGRTLGLNEGRTLGLNEGRTLGLSEGRSDGLRASIVLALSTRGMAPDSAQRARLEGEARVEVLTRWLQRAITASTLDDVFADG